MQPQAQKGELLNVASRPFYLLPDQKLLKPSLTTHVLVDEITNAIWK
jgi:hypothetical protein